MRTVEVENVSKRFRLGQRRYATLRESLASTVRPRRHGGAGEIWALRDVGFAVDQGELVGLVGRNGAGKTTLLKILARITEPTSGVSRTRGRLGSLLDVGTGFHPELTGRENVFLNGAILGMRRTEVARQFDEIVDFSGVERFIDTPVKRYSSGMYLRLAFAVAAHLDSDIMVVDEVLAVGDAEFQRKCLGKMAEVERSGRTVMFVSHNLDAVMRLCTRALWLDAGRLLDDGPTGEVVDRYLATSVDHAAVATVPADPAAPLAVDRIAVLDCDGRPGTVLARDAPFVVEVELTAARPVAGLDVGIAVQNLRGVRLLDEAWSDVAPADRGAPGRYRFRMVIPPLLNAGDYAVSVWVGTPYDTIVWADAAVTFRLEGATQGRSERALQLRLDWDVRHEPPP